MLIYMNGRSVQQVNRFIYNNVPITTAKSERIC